MQRCVWIGHGEENIQASVPMAPVWIHSEQEEFEDFGQCSVQFILTGYLPVFAGYFAGVCSKDEKQ